MFHRNYNHHFGYATVIALGFFCLILAGSVLLCLPIASKAGTFTNYTDSLFTAASATCVTGLVTVDTFSHWSLFGQIVILILIQVGGLGFMTISMTFFFFFHKRIGLRERGLLKESVSIMYIGGVVRLARKILFGTLLFESMGAVLLSIRFVPKMGLLRGVYNGIFHSVSAFCNAGFDLMGRYEKYSSLVRYQDDILVNLVIMALIIIGGIGFFVWDDISKNGLHFKNYELHTKIVLTTTVLLLVSGTVFFYLMENDGVLKGMSGGEKLLASMFASVTPRTAGFNTTDTAALSEGSRMLTILLMFIGGSPGSTAGGIKTTTAVVVFMSLIAGLRRTKDCNIFKRRIGEDIMRRAHSLFTLNLSLSCLAVLVIASIQGFLLSDVMFEVFSAIGTVGMSTGITRQLIPASKIILILLMYCGRVGSLSFALIFTEKKVESPVKYPAEKIIVG